MKIALYHRYIDPADLPALDQLIAELQRHHVDTVTVADGDSIAGFDYLFSIGGDGTLLSSVQLVSPLSARSTPILGINFGHLGFLTTAGKDNLAALVDDLLAGHFTLEQRTLLHLSPLTSHLSSSLALNEVFLHRGDSMSLLRTRVTVNGEYVATYAGDGVIVATPTGSTAYSLSCGGPILTPDSRCFVITPICAHTLTLRPIIVPDSAVIELSVEAPQYTLGIDSRRHPLSGAATVQLRCAPFSVSLIRMNTQNFFSAIRDKLNWGL
jgi:NAD+ kinase